MKYSLATSNFIEEISCLLHCNLSLYFFALFTWEGLYSLDFCVQLDVSFPFSLAFYLFSQLFIKPPQKATLPSCISFFVEWFWSLPAVQGYEPPSIVLQAICLPNLSLQSICHLHCITIKALIKIILEWWFSLLSSFKPEFYKELLVWATFSSRSRFCWWYRASPFLAAKNAINLILVSTIWWCQCVV